ncbi:Multidrug resistance-associated protein 1 [Nymphon striatum]|nr:Multidrug resistance-associated protein 1 [Nymphon striatum]
MEILFCTTPLWNESLTWNTANPVFTECFQETILVWIPTFFLLLSVPYEACMLSHRTYDPIAWNYKIISKLLLLLLLIIAQLTETIMLLATYDRSVFKFLLTQKEISSILLSIIFVTALILLILHRSKGLHTSGILFYFWLLMLLTELFRYRSSITEDFRQVEVQIFLTATGLAILPLVFAIFLLELFSMDASTSGYKYFKLNGNAYENIESPEWKASYFSQLLFWWIMPMCFKGSKQPLVSTDVYDLIEENKSNYLGQQLERILKKNYNNIGRGLFKQFGPRLFISSVICVIATLLTFANPLIMEQDGRHSHVNFIATVCLGAKELGRYGFSRAALRLSSSAKKDWTSGEVVNLVAVDVHRIHEGLQFSFNLISGTVFLTIATYYLFIYLGIATLAGLSVLAVLIPINTGISNLVHIIQKEFLDIKDQRVKMITEVLAGMKVLKLYAWESPFEDMIIKLRAKEVRFLKKSLLVEISMINIFIFSPFGVSLLAFITFVYSSNQILTPSVAFVSLYLFSIIKIPMWEVPFVIGDLIKAYASLQRISSFMSSEELDANVVCMKNGTFSWEKSSKSCLSNINLNVDQGKLIGVVGQVGSGKSSLLSAVLGEMHLKEGRVNVNGSIAYVPQQAWILNATVRENILFDSDLKCEKYQDILNKCALEDDLQILAGGDLTEIGEKESKTTKQQVCLFNMAEEEYEISSDSNSIDISSDLSDFSAEDYLTEPEESVQIGAVLGSLGPSYLINPPQILITSIKGVNVGRLNINNLRYTDDSVLLAEDEGQLQLILNRTIEEGEKYGMRMNVKNTKCMVFSKLAESERCTLTLNGTLIKKVNAFVHLGQMLHEDGRSDAEIKRRIAIARNNFAKIAYGINLSGGQKQRVSLARAVYNDADIYLLDDPLSAVDSHVGKYLFDNVIGHNGILHNKTRLLVTHGLKYLPNCDFVVVMKDGQISESGTYEDLMERSKVFSELMKQYTCSSAEEENSVKIQNRKISEMLMKEEFEKGQKLDIISVDSVNASHEDITSTKQ